MSPPLNLGAEEPPRGHSTGPPCPTTPASVMKFKCYGGPLDGRSVRLQHPENGFEVWADGHAQPVCYRPRSYRSADGAWRVWVLAPDDVRVYEARIFADYALHDPSAFEWRTPTGDYERR